MIIIKSSVICKSAICAIHSQPSIHWYIQHLGTVRFLHKLFTTFELKESIDHPVGLGKVRLVKLESCEKLVLKSFCSQMQLVCFARLYIEHRPSQGKPFHRWITCHVIVFMPLMNSCSPRAVYSFTYWHLSSDSQTTVSVLLMDNEDLISTGHFDFGITDEGTHTIEAESDGTMTPRVDNAIDAMAGARYIWTWYLDISKLNSTRLLKLSQHLPKIWPLKSFVHINIPVHA